MIDRTKPIPLHFQINNDLREAIKAGTWGVGELFPNDKQLMEKYGVSSVTVRRAVAELVHEGLLERVPGKGTFVKRVIMEEVRGRLTGFFEEMRAKGVHPSAEILQAVAVDSSRDYRDLPQLKVFKETKLMMMERVHKMDDQPVIFIRSFLPFHIGSQLVNYDLCNRGFYEVFEEELGILVDEAEQVISTALAEPKQAKVLQIPTKTPLLIVERTTYASGNPIEFAINAYRSDRYKYRVHLHRDKRPGEGGNSIG